LKMCDTIGIGEEAWINLTSYSLKGADAVLIFFSVTNRSSFEFAEAYLNVARKECPDAQMLLIGNKCDITKEGGRNETRQVAYDEAEGFASNQGLTYVETSVKENLNVSEVFEMIAKEKLRRLDEEKPKKSKDSSCSIF